MARPGCMLEQMFKEIATKEELTMLRERFYDRGNYGGATTWLTRKIFPIWMELVRKNNGSKVRLSVRTTPQAKDWDIPNLLSNN